MFSRRSKIIGCFFVLGILSIAIFTARAKENQGTDGKYVSDISQDKLTKNEMMTKPGNSVNNNHYRSLKEMRNGDLEYEIFKIKNDINENKFIERLNREIVPHDEMLRAKFMLERLAFIEGEIVRRKTESLGPDLELAFDKINKELVEINDMLIE